MEWGRMSQGDGLRCGSGEEAVQHTQTNGRAVYRTQSREQADRVTGRQTACGRPRGKAAFQSGRSLALKLFVQCKCNMSNMIVMSEL